MEPQIINRKDCKTMNEELNLSEHIRELNVNGRSLSEEEQKLFEEFNSYKKDRESLEKWRQEIKAQAAEKKHKKEQEKERIFEMAKAFLESADRAYCTNDYMLSITYLLLYRILWEYVKDNLESEQYSLFCKEQIDFWENLYM